MVRLDALKCSKCEKQFDRALVDGKLREVEFCNDCGKLYCAFCSPTDCGPCSGTANPSCGKQSSKLLSTICSLIGHAPADELFLIDLHTRMNRTRCSVCNTTTSPFLRFGIQEILCESCSADVPQLHTFCGNAEVIFRKIICELGDKFMPRTRVQRPGIRGGLPMRTYFTCESCESGIEENRVCSLFPLLLDGETYCFGCGTEAHQYYSASRLCFCLGRLADFVRCIPENQLPLLTFSKWIRSIGCERHKDILYDLFVDRGSRKGELHSFFKKEETVSTSCNEETKAPSTPDKLFPARIVCSCGREEDLSNMFDCLTCSTYGVCTYCLAKKHWGHEIKESTYAVAFCLINSQSETTRQKLVEMVGQAKELKGAEPFEKLCHALSYAFNDAMNSEDLQRIQTLLIKANTSDLEKYFKDAMNGTKKLYKFIDAFCEDLLKAVEEEKQNDASKEESSRTSREETKNIETQKS